MVLVPAERSNKEPHSEQKQREPTIFIFAREGFHKKRKEKLNLGKSSNKAANDQHKAKLAFRFFLQF